MQHSFRVALKRLLVFGITVLGAATLWSCGVADWLIGNNIDVNGARGTLTQEHTAIGGYKVTQLFLGNKNNFEKVDIVAALTGGETCKDASGGSDTGRFKEDVDADYGCVAWAFDCFYRFQPGQCPPYSPDAAIPPNGAKTELYELFTSSKEANPQFTLTLNGKAEALRLRRNAVQERLVAASNSACRDFTQHLNTYQSYTNFILGTAAVGTGAAGGIVSSAIAARALAGITGAISGTRAEFNSDLFAQKLVATIVQAIDQSREDYLVTLRGKDIEGLQRTLLNERIQQAIAAAASSPNSSASPAADPPAAAASAAAPAAAASAAAPAAAASAAAPAAPAPAAAASAAAAAAASAAAAAASAAAAQAKFIPTESLPQVGKQQFNIVEYPVEGAIADAIYYNDLCSLDKGLQTLTESLSAFKHPGLDEALDVVKQVDAIRQVEQGGTFALPSPTATPTPNPAVSGRIKVTPAQLTFNTPVKVGDTDSKSVTIKDTAKATLKITSITISGPFSIPPGLGAFPVEPGSPVDIPVTFAPTASGKTLGTMNIQSSDPSGVPKAVILTGVGS
jgi:hypothetical protein